MPRYIRTLLCGHMNSHIDANHTPHERRYTVNEAAEVLGISAEAVRARINRGTLHKEKDTDGTVYVRMDGDHTHPDDCTNGRTAGDDMGDHTVGQSLAFQVMQNQIAFLQAELERKDAILLTLAQRIPELEASGADLSPSEDSSNGHHVPPENQGPSDRRSWWRRLFEV